MSVKSVIFCIVSLFYILALIGCSGVSNTVLPDQNPISPGTELNSTGLLGVYELTIDPENLTAELQSKRAADIGESYIVNGRAFFETAPCTTCLRIKSLKWHPDSISINFELQHPIPAGNSGLPASAMNRFDLDVFDVTALIRSTQHHFVYLDQLDKRIPDFLPIKNPDGYTGELESLTIETELIPYVLVVDDSETGTSTWNMFEQGTTREFEIDFIKQYNKPISFDMYITMAYGVSARFATRMTPKYYNPEFNRKAAWKVEAEPLGLWASNDSTSLVGVEVRVWDWQQGATVATEPNFADADPGSVYASSDVSSVTVSIEAMTSAYITSTTPVSGTGMPNDPLIYRVLMKNENLAMPGQYSGLVRVLDSRPVLTTGDPRDILIDTVNGVDMEKYTMPEYATYHLFKAVVTDPCIGHCWTNAFGGIYSDNSNSAATDKYGCVYITGDFIDLVNFNPSDPEYSYSHRYDVFLCKYDPSGELLWVRTWGGSFGDDTGTGVAVDSQDNVYVTGNFTGSCEFNPSGGNRSTSNGLSDVFVCKFTPIGQLIWAKTFGGSDIELAQCLDINSDDSVYIGGAFRGTTNLVPLEYHPVVSNGGYDSFIVCLDSSGEWLGDAVWGGTSEDVVYSLAVDESDSVIAAGNFGGDVDFDPIGEYIRSSNGIADCFITKFDSLGQWQWARTWGGTQNDLASSIDCDSSNYIYVAGYYGGTVEFNPSGGYPETSNGDIDCFVSKFDPSGNWWWTASWGGTDSDVVSSLHIDNMGNLYLAGYYQGDVYFNPVGGGYQQGIGFRDIYVSLFDLDGIWQWTRTWGGTNDDYIKSVTTDSGGNLFATGEFYGTANFNPSGGVERTSNGGYDVFLSRLNY